MQNEVKRHGHAREPTLTQVRGAHFIAEALDDEVIVYDRRSHTAHLLDLHSAEVWKAAETTISVSHVLRLMPGDSECEKQAMAHLTISGLEKAGLVTSDLGHVPRRRLLRTISAAVALPAVISVLAPTPAAAASNLPNGAICVVAVDTCAGPGRTCQDLDGPGGDPPRCCVAAATTDQHLGGQVCAANDECCSGVCNLIGGVCVGD